MPGKHLTKIEEAYIIKLYTNGLYEKEICERTQRSVRTIYTVLRRNEIPRSRRGRYGTRASGWKGGRIKTTEGYISVLLPPDHPLISMAEKSRYVKEHRLVVAESLGRPLEKHEQIHHINGDRTDNRIENLQLVFSGHGNGVVLQCQDCGSHNIRSIETQKTRRKGNDKSS